MSLLITRGLGKSGGLVAYEGVPELIEVEEEMELIEVDDDQEIEVIVLGKKKEEKEFK